MTNEGLRFVALLLFGYVNRKGIIKMKKLKTLSTEEKLTIQLFLGIVIALAGLSLLFISFFVDPLGIIHNSVLAATGEVFTFSGALIGIDYSYKYKMYERNRSEMDEEE